MKGVIMKEVIEYLQSVNAALNSISVQGYQNCAMVAACMNNINKALALLSKPAESESTKSDGGKQ